MDGLELRQTLMQTLINGLKKAGEDRDAASGGPRFAELTGRIEAFRTLLDYLLNVQVGPCDACQAVQSVSKEGPKEPAPPEDGGSKPKKKGKNKEAK